MEHKTLPPPNNHQEDENIFRIRRENWFRPPQPDTNPNVRKGTKITEKRKRVASTKRFKAKIAVEPNSNKTITYLPNTKALMDTESQKTLKPTPESRTPPLEDAPVHTGNPWPEAGKMSGNLFEARKDWLLPPNHIDDNTKSTANATSPKPP